MSTASVPVADDEVLHPGEREELAARLAQARTLESLGRLAGGVAHELNNLLGIVTGYAELLRDRLVDDPELARFAGEVFDAAGRAAGLSHQLLAFSRRQVLQPRLLDLSALVRGHEEMLRRLLGEGVELETRLADRLPLVRADPGQLEQALAHLAARARDAMPRGGRLLVETRLVERDERYARLHPGVEAGRYVALAMSDTGQGLAPEVRERIFEPFLPLDEAGRGNGLGLAAVHGIAGQSGGHVRVASEAGRGTTFEVCLPVVVEGLEGA